MKKIILGFILGGIVFTLGGVVATTAISSTNVTYQNKTVNSALDELYDEAVTGKELVAAAITNKGVSTTSTDTYQTMANKINNIDTDHSELSQKISNLESKHNTDIASLTGSISNLNQNLLNINIPVTIQSTAVSSGKININKIGDVVYIYIAILVKNSFTAWQPAELGSYTSNVIKNKLIFPITNMNAKTDTNQSSLVIVIDPETKKLIINPYDKTVSVNGWFLYAGAIVDQSFN